MTIRMAIVGTGYISRFHAAAVRSLAEVEIVAVVNHRPESMTTFAAEFEIKRQYLDIDELLKDGGIDAISINTPNYLHAPQSIAALRNGVHVIVEKPMAMHAAEAAAMQAASLESGSLLMVAHCWRFDEEVLWLREQAHRLGQIIHTKSIGVHVNWGPGGWFTQQKFAGGGALDDMGIHAIDTTRFLLGDPQPVTVWARIGTFYSQHDVDDTGVILVNWDNGVTSYFESGWWQPHADGPEASTQLYGASGFGSLFPTVMRLPNRERESVDQIDPGYLHPRPEHCPQIMYDAQMAYFIDCIRQGRRPSPGGEEGLLNMKIVDAAYESGRTGKLVEFS